MPAEQTEESSEALEIRAEVRAWLDSAWDPDLTVRAWWQRLGESGWAFPTWPREWFGKGLGSELAGPVRDEIRRAGALGAPGGLGQGLAAPTIIAHATEEQKRWWLGPLAIGQEAWCQFFSEPSSGSDLASLQTRAVRDGDEWVVNGQKVWTSGARAAVRGMLLARTDSEAPKHRGITYFIIDVDQPGVEIRPLKQMNGAESFNEVFFTDARVPHANVVGEQNNGWAVAITTLAYERSGIGGGLLGSATPGEKAGVLDRRVGDVVAGVGNVATTGSMSSGMAGGSRLLRRAAEAMARTNDPLVRDRVARLHTMTEATRLTNERAMAAVRAGGRPGPEGSTGKLAAAVNLHATRDVGMSILGAHGMLIGADAPLGGEVQNVALSAHAISIAGGTNEIQRNIIGERVLGLPKEPSVDRDVPFRDLRVGTQRDD
ncbi:MAG TPA: acyl-CoA dehydrogenase family protein [Acidimicrobiales bacterium]|nr:acyl-CoA dehydrogenase family protein [Acidimicrobiales bacterium]